MAGGEGVERLPTGASMITVQATSFSPVSDQSFHLWHREGCWVSCVVGRGCECLVFPTVGLGAGWAQRKKKQAPGCALLCCERGARAGLKQGQGPSQDLRRCDRRGDVLR